MDKRKTNNSWLYRIICPQLHGFNNNIRKKVGLKTYKENEEIVGEVSSMLNFKKWKKDTNL